ncbi:uncharacterized protein LOC110726404 [Chenopodium quinoa]|uniref:uncharacterized protein LOC110726404 n=1 Tax=Chenopodium quinoa TaxID=63459 RepID=UPI000B78DAB7|nr:uncharacterized protein LOC110726404 [Chenopodium quinoa]
MEENPSISMARAAKIIRKSIYTFLQHYQFFTSVAAFIALPFSISVLISLAIVPRSFALLPTVYGRLHSVFLAAGFPPYSDFFTLLSLKLSQTISSSIVTLPFTLSFLLLAKASIIHFFSYKKTTNNNSSSSFIALYHPILSTHLCNTFIIFAANATCFSLLFLAFNFLEGFQLDSPRWVLFLSALGAVFYSIILANSFVVCNLALVSSGIERRGGFLSILKACVSIRGKTSTALALAVPTNLGLAAVEALFHFRIIATAQHPINSTSLWLVAFEGVLIAYIYSILVVLDVIMSCVFYQCCKNDQRYIQQVVQGYVVNDQDASVTEVDDDYCYYDYNEEKLKGLEEFV